jgi:hypothetical protein
MLLSRSPGPDPTLLVLGRGPALQIHFTDMVVSVPRVLQGVGVHGLSCHGG